MGIATNPFSPEFTQLPNQGLYTMFHYDCTTNVINRLEITFRRVLRVLGVI